MKTILKKGDLFVSKGSYITYAKITNIYEPKDYDYNAIKKQKGWEGRPIVIKFESTIHKDDSFGMINHFTKTAFLKKYYNCIIERTK